MMLGGALYGGALLGWALFGGTAGDTLVGRGALAIFFLSHFG